MAERRGDQSGSKSASKRGIIAAIAVLMLGGMSVFAARVAFSASDLGHEAAIAPVIAADPAPGMSGMVIPEPAHAARDPAQAALIARGRYLTVAGDCMPCHTVPGGQAFAGGQAVETPFGAVFSPNITPSKRFGIGNWTDQQFWAALHQGIGPGRSLLVFPKYLYPVMPYTSYSKLSHGDVMAIKAYLDSLQPAQNPDRPSQMDFPFDVRAGLLAWRLVFFDPKPVQYQPGWSPAVRNGAYLVQALEHCSACHTPRNIAMATEPAHYLAGGHIVSQSWFAPNISSSKQYGVGAWDAASLVTYLHDDGDLQKGAAFGPMKEVVDDSLSRLPVADVQDIAAYLQTATKPQHTPPPPADHAASPKLGQAVYASYCARCHEASGQGVARNFPNLAHNQALWEGQPINVVSMVLGGFQPWHPDQSSMPAFGQTLTDTQIAAVTNYIRSAWGEQPEGRNNADATAAEVAAWRATSDDEIGLDDGTTKASLMQSSGRSTLAQISGHLTFSHNRRNCMIDARFLPVEGGASATPIHLAGACADDGQQIIGDVTMNGQTHKVRLGVRDILNGAHVAGLAITGPIAGGATLHAHIAFVTANY